MNLLLVEDERKLAAAVSQGLTGNGYTVTVANTGEEGIHVLHSRDFDLVLLDLMLPHRSGMEILKDLRKCGFKMPVLILTSRDSVQDRVLGLNAGADDYLVKPFASSELLARVRALLRRGKIGNPASMKLQLSDLEVDLATRIARRGAQLLDLTAKEFRLLQYFMTNEGRVVSREMLARDVWKETARHTPLDNVIDVQIARLRRKMDDPFSEKLLHTVRGIGFVLRKQQER